MTKDFPLGTVLTVTTHRLLCEMDDLYEILEHLTGTTLLTHQLPRAGKACKEPLLTQFPALRDITVPDLDSRETYQAWMASQESIYGTTLPVAPLDEGIYERKDPVTEAIEEIGRRHQCSTEEAAKRVVPVVVPEGRKDTS